VRSGDGGEDISGAFDPDDLLSPEERARTIAGRYEIVERIGEGGMGQVLRVRHRRLGKPFALKLMKADFSLEPEAHGVFIREAKLASVLSHPGIVSIVDFGDDPDWGLFIVMEYIEGDTLTQRIERCGPLPIPVVCDVTGQLLAALRHIHAHDVVHGDLKADNVLCINDPEPDRRQWNAKLLDFGMAQVASAAHGETRIGGTPEYLAPERIRGGPLTPMVDLYALGIIMYEMLTGHMPFSGEPSQVLERQLSEAPAPIASLRKEPVDAALAAIVDRALAKDPAERYRSADELNNDLRGYMKGLGLHRRNTRRASTMSGELRTAAAAAAFDALGVATIGIRIDGTIVLANPAMARMLRCDDPGELEGESLRDTPLARMHAELLDDLRLVAVDGKTVRRRLRIARTGGKSAIMRLLMTPSSGPGGDCMLSIYPLPLAH